MATLITKHIGSAYPTGRDYATIQDFIAAIPSDLVAADEAWLGLLYNDSEFTITAELTCTKTTSATCYVEMRPASGEGFAEHASHLTNPLKYDQSKGVGIHFNLDWTPGFSFNGTNHLTISGVQARSTTSYIERVFDVKGANSRLARSLIEMKSDHTVISVDGGGLVENNIIIYTSGAPTTSSINLGWDSATANNNTFYVSAGGATKAIKGYSATSAKNNLLIGYNSNAIICASASNTATTAAADLGSGNVYSITAADVVENATYATLDLRTKSGAVTIGAGATGTGVTLDILGQTRASPPGIGAHEYVAGGTDGSVTGGTGSGTGSGTGGDATGVTVGNGSVTGGTGTGTGSGAGGDATGAAGTGSVTVGPLENSPGSLWLSQSVAWTWAPLGRVGSMESITVVDGTGTTHATTGVLTVSGLAVGDGEMRVVKLGATAFDDLHYVEYGTVA